MEKEDLNLAILTLEEITGKANQAPLNILHLDLKKTLLVSEA